MNSILANLKVAPSVNSFKTDSQECVLERKIREGVIEIFFDDKAKKVRSCLSGKQLPNFSLPSNLNKIHDVKVLKSYLQDVCIRAVVGSDGMVRIELFQRGKGGMIQESNPSSARVIPQQDLASIGNDPSGGALVAYLESHPNLQVQVTDLQKGCYHVDVQETMRDLLQVSDLFRAAWSGAMSDRFTTIITGITTNYQHFLKQSLVTSGVYTQNCVQAIKFHGEAIKLLQSNKVELALKILSQCEKAADVMAQQTKVLVQLCNQLVHKHQKALIQLCRQLQRDVNSSKYRTIVSAFSNTKMFWEGVEANCAILKEREILRIYIEAEQIDDALEEMYQSALEWMTLGCISKKIFETTLPDSQSISFKGLSTMSENQAYLAALSDQGSEIVSKVKSLNRFPQEKSLQVCTEIKHQINLVVRLAESLAKKFSQIEGGMKVELQNLAKKIADKQRSITAFSEKIGRLQADVEKSKAMINKSEEQKREMKAELQRLRKQVEEEEQARIDGATDMIPFVGLIGGLVTGRYERMIPGYSTVKGLASLITDEVEKLEERANRKAEKIDENRRNLRHLKEKKRMRKSDLSDQKRKLQKTEEKKIKAEAGLKDAGKVKTLLSHFTTGFQQVSQRYCSNRNDLEMLEIMIDAGESISDEIEGMVQSLAICQREIRALTY